MNADIHASELMSSITIRVRGLKAMGVRLWLAARLLALAGLVSGVNLVIESE